MRDYIDVTGKNEDEAISKALAQLGLDRDDVSVEVLERAKSGFLGLGACPAKIRVYYGPEAEEEILPPPPPPQPGAGPGAAWQEEARTFRCRRSRWLHCCLGPWLPVYAPAGCFFPPELIGPSRPYGTDPRRHIL